MGPEGMGRFGGWGGLRGLLGADTLSFLLGSFTGATSG